MWAALYRPQAQNAERAAIMHIHGGGYRQFAHRGYSVYGYATHLGFMHYMLEQGYTVLDFDYRGSAGFGRDYRTDISESMGISDTDGAAAAARWLAANENVHPERIGIYGVSYGGFLTLTSLFRYPGVFGAGIARAAVSRPDVGSGACAGRHPRVRGQLDCAGGAWRARGGPGGAHRRLHLRRSR